MSFITAISPRLCEPYLATSIPDTDISAYTKITETKVSGRVYKFAATTGFNRTNRTSESKSFQKDIHMTNRMLFLLLMLLTSATQASQYHGPVQTFELRFEH